MRPIRKTVYHLVKETELRKLLREAGLDAKGDKTSLVKRHQRFAAIWNTQCQLVSARHLPRTILSFSSSLRPRQDNPLSKMEIIMQVKREEQGEKREQTAAGARNELLQYDR